MYGNNFGYPFIGGINPPVMPPMTRGIINPMTMGIRGATRSGGLRSLLGLGSTARGATSGFSFTNLLNGASKTLGVVKDAIPIVKEVGPMMNNMKSMLKIASVFKDETDTSTRANTNNSTNIKKEVTQNKEATPTKSDNIDSVTTTSNYQNEPNFFL